ncbi:Ldh family oxidoreductase [Mycobacterium sp. NAZ190054]|uniref:Ldh family oxidoreductase n=1 Tax=Mycobacterium sp. NAZ190054 TaxID=1747766 RepID=UPI000794C16C|nr:Ldh family oxidoreductase [Mycobacterium sp. NAZ190054]KWX67787.1 hypothetical protein ASJ79_20450 [Mycobacterium sp. NAZ190054]
MTSSAAAERVHLTPEQAQNLSHRALRAIGYSVEEARIIAEHVVDAALCGYEYLGLTKILRLSSHYTGNRAPVKTVAASAVSAMVDGGGNTGMLVMPYAVKELIGRAKASGIAVVGVTNSWMSGRSAYYCEKVAREGLICIHTASGSPLVAPPGGRVAAVGTNPLAFGFPADPDPLVIDLGTSTIAATDLEQHHRLGLPLPDGTAIGADGEPTSDAARATDGALLPFAGHKGFALAMAVHAIGVICAPADAEGFVTGHVFIAFAPDMFLPAGDYQRRLATQLDLIRKTPRRPEVSEIRIPGERAYRTREVSLRDGIFVDRKIYNAVVTLASSAPS